MWLLVRETANASAAYHLVNWLIGRIEREPQIRVCEPTDYFPGSQTEDIWSNGESVSVSLIVVPTLGVPVAVPVRKDRAIIAFHSGPDQMLGNPYRYYPLLHEFGHVGGLHTRAIAFAPRNSFGYISTAALVVAFAHPVHWLLLPLIIAFACWASMFCYHEETLQAEVAADHFALEATHDLARAGFFRTADNVGPVYDDGPLQGLDNALPKHLQETRSMIFGMMRADVRTKGVADLDYYTTLAIRHHGMQVEGLIVSGFALALVACSIFLVQDVSWPSPLALIVPAMLAIFYALVSERYTELGKRLLKILMESDPEGAERSLQAVLEWSAKSRPRTLAMWGWLERLDQWLDRRR
ncbi:hypothetical protein E4K66_05320 [Bradyrhizobium frederickii]|uniref:Uncharacterized protein n=1 Tax=Bradyrhizobium frederickii TaxID=2560054 RepID=A0A4Y9LGF3_9BRAD|nr:hypothetical protein [Bradyrhizobium frederickii]TFV41737.1 hypothetical protein E4K66_05320 [Bradyrhizobium frederickii]